MNKFIILFLIAGLAASMVLVSGFSVSLVEAKDSGCDDDGRVIQEPVIMVTMAVATAVQVTMVTMAVATAVQVTMVTMAVATAVQVIMAATAVQVIMAATTEVTIIVIRATVTLAV